MPQSRVPLPPLVTPAGTSITIGTPPQQGSSGSNTPLKVNAPQTNGTTAAAKAAAGSGKAATTVEEAADDDQVSCRLLFSLSSSPHLLSLSLFSLLPDFFFIFCSHLLLGRSRARPKVKWHHEPEIPRGIGNEKQLAHGV